MCICKLSAGSGWRLRRWRSFLFNCNIYAIRVRWRRNPTGTPLQRWSTADNYDCLQLTGTSHHPYPVNLNDFLFILLFLVVCFFFAANSIGSFAMPSHYDCSYCRHSSMTAFLFFLSRLVSCVQHKSCLNDGWFLVILLCEMALRCGNKFIAAGIFNKLLNVWTIANLIDWERGIWKRNRYVTSGGMGAGWSDHVCEMESC